MVKLMYNRDFIHGKAVNSNNDLEWNEYRSMRNYFNNIVKCAKEEYCENIVNENSQNPKTLWKNINNIIRENKYFAQTHDITASRLNDFFSTIGENVSNRLSGSQIWNGQTHLPSILSHSLMFSGTVC